MPPVIEDEYRTVGGNKNSAAADWSVASGLVSFGADQNVAIWSPLNGSGRGLSSLLSGHNAKVTAVKFLSTSDEPATSEVLVTGAADGEIRLWETGERWKCVDKATAHDGSVNTIAVLSQSSVFATGGADAEIRLWRVDNGKLQALSSLTLKPKFMPLALALGPFSGTADNDSAFLVVGGTRNDIQVYSIEDVSTTPQFKLCATLPGHEAWIRSLALTPVSESGFLLASASQDKYVRLWRFQSGDFVNGKKAIDASNLSNGTNTLSAKVQSVSAGGKKYSITFEALLLGHEDWVYSAAWSPKTSTPQLLTASADGSLSVWESDPVSGIWISISRLGEISGQKGATTATGSSGGFWTGLWSPNGEMVTCLGRTGSWRLWQYNAESQFWTQKYAVSGHINSVNGIIWSPDGSYLLSTSSDQTTRLHAEWKRGEKRSWHEFSRPQIHGYDLNCIATTTPHQFSSGADEKLLRVFNEPKDIAQMLHRLCQIPLPDTDKQLPDTAAIPVLGLSNKAVDDTEEAPDAAMEGLSVTDGMGASLLDIQEPPTEDLLSRHTLWPEHEKLYGHGYEISEAAAPTDGSVLATACKASSLDHAVIRLYDTNSWNEMKPPLKAHSLTVTRLAFSTQPAGYLLSVGRDRQFAVFRRSEDAQGAQTWTRVATNNKAHSRMILDAAWLENAQRPTFATAGRDKSVKVWVADPNSEQLEFVCKAQITRKTAVTAISVLSCGGRSILAAGEDDGTISLHLLQYDDNLENVKVTSTNVDDYLCPSKTINQLAWRPVDTSRDETGQLAIASADGSVRILKVDWRGWTDADV
ncbi:elongator complex protein 2 [Exophiala viscosa]|uniref:Elongator complex protein 2 n=1 Tax=Exophiala viscosa TaxID=2486360 RepID=A0AAN6E755_9EURO|nr:elongator complex protein 2 [Exophiala viscosa]